MQGQVFIAQGDITRLCADAIAVTNGVTFNRLIAGMMPSNARAGDEPLSREEAVWIPLPGAVPPRPQGFVQVPYIGWRAEHDTDDTHPAGAMVRNAIRIAITNLRRKAEESGGKRRKRENLTDTFSSP